MPTPLEVLKMIQEDCEFDATKPVEFTKLGIGTIYGELLATISALAHIIEEHLKEVTDANSGERPSTEA